jgi:hypothetical protein
MEKIGSSFKGVWSVVATEIRLRGEWQREYDFEPDEWLTGFMEGGRWIEAFRPEDELLSGRWVFDDHTGRLLTALDATPELLSHHVFETDETGVWLYTYDEAQHIPFDRQSIIAHHAHRRQRLVEIRDSPLPPKVE